MILTSIPRWRHAVRRARMALIAVLGACLCVVAGTTIALAAGHRATAGSWGTARRGPGASGFVQLLNFGSGFTLQDGLACPFPRDCTVFYRGPGRSTSRHQPAFRTVRLIRGRWGRPREVPGLATIYYSFFGCARPGACLAAGARPEKARSQVDLAAAAIEVRGTWHAAIPVPGLAALGGNAGSAVTAEACSRSDWCILAGYIRHKKVGDFLISERSGAWTKPHPVPGLIGSISCDPAGACTAVGSRPNGLFAVSGTDGAWHAARPIAVPAALQGAQLGAVSCTSASDCTAIGELGQEGVTAPQVLAVTERHGSWGTLSVLPGTTGYHAINGDLADTMVTSLSCTAPGQCVMTGYHASDSYGEYDNIDQALPFIATQVNGAWQAARALPGLAALNRGGVADIASASCASPGNCAVTGFYTLAGCNAQVCYERPFVAAEIRGAWSRAQSVPGLAVQITGINAGAFISCSRAAGCVAVGSYKGRGGFPPTRLWATFRG